MAVSLGRLVIYTSKIDEMVAFYTRHFDFETVQADNDRITELKPTDQGASLMLHPSTRSLGQTLVKLVFDVEDVPGFIEISKQNGLDFGSIHRADGYVFSNAKDPSGNSIQISNRAYRS